MAEYRNDTAEVIAIEWCVNPDHYRDGVHSGTEGCHMKSHTIEPGETLTFSDAPNKTKITDLCEAVGLRPKE